MGISARMVSVWYVSTSSAWADSRTDPIWSERDAMGCDLYHPVSRVGSNLTDAGGIGYMVVDAIDSLILLGLDDEYQRAREWVANELSFDRDGVYSTFEVSPPPVGRAEYIIRPS
jgi:hypothetical protein